MRGWRMICPVLVPGCRSTTSPLRGVFWHWERLLQKGSLMSSISQRPTRLSRWTVGPAILDRGIRVMAPMLLPSYRCCSFYGIIDMKLPRGYVHGCVREQKQYWLLTLATVGYPGPSAVVWDYSSTNSGVFERVALSYPVVISVIPYSASSVQSYSVAGVHGYSDYLGQQRALQYRNYGQRCSCKRHQDCRDVCIRSSTDLGGTPSD